MATSTSRASRSTPITTSSSKRRVSSPLLDHTAMLRIPASKASGATTSHRAFPAGARRSTSRAITIHRPTVAARLSTCAMCSGRIPTSRNAASSSTHRKFV